MFYKIILRGLRILKNRQSSNFEDEIKKQLKFKNVFGRIKTHDNLVYADVMKLVDVPDSKSGVVHPTCRFDSGHRHFLLLFYLFLESNLRFLPLAKQYLIVLLGRVAIGIFILHVILRTESEESKFHFRPLRNEQSMFRFSTTKQVLFECEARVHLLYLERLHLISK